MVTLLIGIALAASGVAVYASKAAVSLLDHTPQLTPRVDTLSLDPGTYLVFEALSQPVLGADVVPVLTPRDVTVTSASGEHLATSVPGLLETRTYADVSYRGVVSFTVTRSDTYRIRMVLPPGGHAAVFIAPSLSTTLSRGLGWLGLALLGGALAVLGVVLVIVQSVRRGRRRTVAPLSRRCANGHAAGPADRYCPSCGAPVYAVEPVVQS